MVEGSPSNLETGEITRHVEKAKIAHSTRLAIIERLEAESHENYDLVERLQSCGEELELTCTCCGHWRKVERRCKAKYCPRCAQAHATRASKRYEAAVAAMQWPLFVTYQCRNFKNLQGSELKLLLAGARNIRRQRWFKKCVKGGVASCEVTNIGNGWHPHIHSVIDCEWFSVTIPQPARWKGKKYFLRQARAAVREVSEQWSMALGRKGGVHVKRAYDRSDGINKPIGMEVLKYSVKGTDLIECKEDITPIIRQLCSSRLVVSWGTLYGKKLLLENDGYEGKPCDKCGASAWVPEEVARAMMRSTKGRK